MTFPITWQLEALSKETSTAFKVDAANTLQALRSDIVKGIASWQKLHSNFRQIQSHAACLSVEDVTNPKGIEESNVCLELEGLLHEVSRELDCLLLQYSELQLQSKIENPDILFCLLQRRALAEKKLPKEQEALINEMEICGFHGVHELYKIAYENMRIVVDENRYSPGQIENLLHSHDGNMRKKAFSALVSKCKDQEMLFAQILRNIVGFRLKVYQARDWENPFFEAYHNNRIEEKTVLAMWEALSQHTHLFRHFLRKKQPDTLCWYDLEAPYGSSSTNISYDEASSCIIQAFSRYSEELSSFAEMALKNYWIDAENRENKAYGGFCTPFPNDHESRIFLNYAGTEQNVLVLAHELGHAYHNHVLFDHAELAQMYPITLAETASTACELFVLQEIQKNDPLRTYHDIAQRCCMFFLNMRARFLFEQKLFQQIKKGFVSSENLCEYMQEAQHDAYGGPLDVYHPYFWITKIHFYLTEYPSYNFPYTVGFILSLAILKKAKEDRTTFASWYRLFLQDSAKMSVEAIVKKHFGKDASQPDFWLEAIEPAIVAFKNYC